MNILEEIKRLEARRSTLHNYVIMKLDERDYHGVADAAMDLREIETRLRAFIEFNSTMTKFQDDLRKGA